jgi:hypothetical protein
MAAEECRDRARELFGMAVFETDEAAREQWLLAGEDWMLRWRLWTPTSGYSIKDDGLTLADVAVGPVAPYRFG